MQAFKIREFMKDHPGTAFPAHRTLSAVERKAVTRRIRERLELPEHAALVDIQRTLYEMLSRRPLNVSADDRSFDLTQVIGSVSGYVPNEVFLGWGLEEIDAMASIEVAKWFDDIWYPSADHLFIFDESVKWFVYVDDEGRVHSTKLPERTCA
jgi:hypothetical protein